VGGEGRLASKIPARLTSSEGRRFGLTLGPAFLVIGALLHWRGREVGAALTAAGGVALLFAALAAPRLLEPLQRGWMRFALALSKVTTPIFMGLVYILLISTIGVLARVFGHNSIARPADSTSYWVSRRARHDGKQSMEHQY
jgi:Saxitoxin biosynthesis operon protein SxtJ